jgi:hypothetical protein
LRYGSRRQQPQILLIEKVQGRSIKVEWNFVTGSINLLPGQHRQ